jgi:hypothetical protein
MGRIICGPESEITMPRFLLIALSLLALSLGACSSGGDKNANPVDREDDLRETVPAAFKAIFGGDSAEAYGYFTSDFREQCSLEDFAAVMAIASVFFGDLDPDDIDITVTAVRFEGEKAFVTAEGSIKGEDIDLSSEDSGDEYWVLEDGEWKFGTTVDGDCEGELGGIDDDADATPATGPGSSRNEPAAVGDPVDVNDFRITLLEADTDAETELEDLSEFERTPTPGRRVVLARIRVEHIGDADKDETIQVFESDFKVTGSSNVIHDSFDQGSSCGFYEDTISGEMFPGGTIEGWFCIQVPDNETNLLLIAEPGFGFSANRRYFALGD